MSAPPTSGASDLARRGIVCVALLSGCGRVGLQLTPLDTDDAASGEDAGLSDGVGVGGGQGDVSNHATDAGPLTPEGGPRPADGGPMPDANSGPLSQDGGAAYDGGSPDAGGDCASPCTNPHGTAQCTGGRCTLTCAPGFADCDGEGQNGCETSLDTPQDCAACGHACVSDDGIPVCSAGACATECDLSGVYALKLQVPTSWSAKTFLSAGTGAFTFWVRLDVTQNALSFAATLTPCGEIVPDFRATQPLSEVYGIEFPTTLFDRTPSLPAQTATGTLTELGPGAGLSLARTAILLGVTLNDPVRDPWPSAGALQSVDSDADGERGLTGNYKSSTGYVLPPLNEVGSTRGLRGYVASRFVFSLSGTLDSCGASSGSLATSGVDAHTLGCRVIGDLRDCLSIEADHLDQSGPNFTSGGGSYRLLRVADGASCAMVRAALP